jgi:hypothetical protein
MKISGFEKILALASMLGLLSVSCSREAVPGADGGARQDSVITFTAGFAADGQTPSSDSGTKVAINIDASNSKATVAFTAGDWIYAHSEFVYFKPYEGDRLSDPFQASVVLKDENLNADGTATFSISAPSDSRYENFQFMAADNHNCFGSQASNIMDGLLAYTVTTAKSAFNSVVAGRIPHLGWGKCSSSDKTVTFKNVLTLLRYKVILDDVAYVEFTGNNGENVIGAINIDYYHETVSLGDGYASARSYVSAPGAAGYIALAPGLDLTKGFTVNAYDKDGNVLFALRSDKEFKTVAGKIVDLGTLENNISCYAMWEAGEDIEIGGVTYNKATCGEATLIADGGTVPSDKVGVFFLKGEATVAALGLTSGTEKDVIIVSDSYGGARAKVKFSSSPVSIAVNSLVFKNVEMETGTDADLLKITQMETLTMDGCLVTVNRPLADMSGSFNITNLCLQGNDFIIGSSSEGLLVTGDSDDSSGDLGTYTIENNVFWSGSPKEWHIVKSDPRHGLKLKKLEFSLNTFYNLYSGTHGDSTPKAFLMMGKITSFATFESNLVYTGSIFTAADTPVATAPTAYLSGFYRDEAGENAASILESGSADKWYGTLAALGGSAFYTGGEDYVSGYITLNMANLTEDPFERINLASGVYSIKAAYEDYGAIRFF